jgi:hypothetical protein
MPKRISTPITIDDVAIDFAKDSSITLLWYGKPSRTLQRLETARANGQRFRLTMEPIDG